MAGFEVTTEGLINPVYASARQSIVG